jgi:wyosine [tRNA(Phe)-imidazoG37] synthetase (radical SAM superfamily)
MTPVPVVVLTNGSTLASRRVRRDLAAADIVVPSLDAAAEAAFIRVNRPRAGLTAARTIDGLAAFRREFSGRIWLEVMLVKGVNDRPGHLRALRRAIARIRPDRVQLNTVVRPPAEKTAAPLTGDELEAVRDFLGGEAPVDIIAAFTGEQKPREPRDAAAAILETLRRRPMTASDLGRALGLPLEEVLAQTRRLTQGGLLRERRHGGAAYYEPAPR